MPTYGKNVQLLSSGKVEWIEQLKRVKAMEVQLRKMKNKHKAMGDEPAKGKVIVAKCYTRGHKEE